MISPYLVTPSGPYIILRVVTPGFHLNPSDDEPMFKELNKLVITRSTNQFFGSRFVRRVRFSEEEVNMSNLEFKKGGPLVCSVQTLFLKS